MRQRTFDGEHWFKHGLDLIYRNTFLLHAIAVTQRHAVVLQGLMIDGQTHRGAQGVLAAVSFADGVLFVVLGEEAGAKTMLEATC